MTIVSRLDNICNEIHVAERNLEKCSHVSRTKSQMVECAEMAKKQIKDAREQLAGYRSALDPVVPGEERNTLSDDIVSVSSDIGNAIHQMHLGNIKKAEEILVEINLRIQGYV